MKIETKFNKGDKVWFIYENKAKEQIVNDIEIRIRPETTEISYFMNVGTKDSYKCAIIKEENIYSTREELINNL